MELIILGQPVQGREIYKNQTQWNITRGPYQVIINEWRWDHSNYKNYTYYLKIGSECLLHNQKSVDTPEEAIAIIDTTLSEYISHKKQVEQLY
jgi:hypothetical protein